MEESVLSGENVFTEAPSCFSHGGGSCQFVTSSLHPSAFQQFLACSSPVFVEPSQWEVGSRHILYSPADWSEHFICSGTDFGLVKQTHISVYFCFTLVCLGVFLYERALWSGRCYSTRSHSSFPSLMMNFVNIFLIFGKPLNFSSSFLFSFPLKCVGSWFLVIDDEECYLSNSLICHYFKEYQWLQYLHETHHRSLRMCKIVWTSELQDSFEDNKSRFLGLL